MHLQFLGRVSLFLFFFSLPALMQPLEPASCSTASQNQSMSYSARDNPAESIFTALKHTPKNTQAAIFGPMINQPQGDRQDATDLRTISIVQFPRATCPP